MCNNIDKILSHWGIHRKRYRRLRACIGAGARRIAGPAGGVCRFLVGRRICCLLTGCWVGFVWLWAAGEGRLNECVDSLRCVPAKSKRCSPATENAPMNKMRVSQTSDATKIGTICSNSARLRISLPKSCDSNVREMAHQVIIAFMVAPNSQAPIRYQTEFGSSGPC